MLQVIVHFYGILLCLISSFFWSIIVVCDLKVLFLVFIKTETYFRTMKKYEQWASSIFEHVDVTFIFWPWPPRSGLSITFMRCLYILDTVWGNLWCCRDAVLFGRKRSHDEINARLRAKLPRVGYGDKGLQYTASTENWRQLPVNILGFLRNILSIFHTGFHLWNPFLFIII